MREIDVQGRTFESYDEYLRHVKENANARASSHEKDYSDWAGGKSFAECLDMAGGKGWKEGRDLITKQSQGLYDKVVMKVPQQETIHADAPGACAIIDMGRFVEDSGPDVWIEQQDTTVWVDGAPAKKAVHILVNSTVSCGVSKEIIFGRGAAATALAEVMELCGRSVKLSVCICVDSMNGGFGKTPKTSNQLRIYFTVKDYDQRANYDLLAFALAHAGSFRRLGFGEMESFTQPVRAKFGVAPDGWGYGYPADPADYSADLNGESVDIYLGKGGLWEDQWRDADKAETWILGKLREQGVVLLED